MAANPEMPTPKPSFMYILSNSGGFFIVQIVVSLTFFAGLMKL